MEIGQRGVGLVPPRLLALGLIPGRVAIAHVGHDEVALSRARRDEESAELLRLADDVEVGVGVAERVVLGAPGGGVQADPGRGGVFPDHGDHAAPEPGHAVLFRAAVGGIGALDRGGQRVRILAGVLGVAPEIRLDVHQRPGAAEALEQEAEVVEITSQECGVVHGGHLGDALGHAARLEDLVIREHGDLLIALGRAHEARHVLTGRHLIVLPAPPPAAARGVGAGQPARGAAARARGARRGAVEDAAGEVAVTAVEGRGGRGGVFHRGADHEVTDAEIGEQRAGEAARAAGSGAAARRGRGLPAAAAAAAAAAAVAAARGDAQGEDGEREPESKRIHHGPP